MEEEKNTHFFKVLIPGFQKKLNLPPSFCKKLKQEKSERNLPPSFCKKLKQEKSERALLTSRKGTFKIKVCRNSEDVISFEVGWPKFVESHSMSVGDFVVFEHVGRLNFNVFVFGLSGCEKEFLNKSNENTVDVDVASPTSHKKSKRGKGKECTVAPYNEENPHFFTTMRLSHEIYSELCIPMEFVRMNNLRGKTNATLRDCCGRSWPMTLCARKNLDYRLSICGGWRDFYVSNELKIGDVCVFYLNPDPPTSKTILFDVKIHPSL